MKTKLSACVIQKFNGYDLLRNTLQCSEKTELVPIDIVYEPTLDVIKPILCFLEHKFIQHTRHFRKKFLETTKKVC